MNNPQQDLENLLYRVDYMRGRQRSYFMQRNETYLRMAKQAEKEVDQLLGQLSKKGYKIQAPIVSQQKQIF